MSKSVYHRNLVCDARLVPVKMAYKRLPPEPGVRRTPSPREDGHKILPPEPGVRSTPSPCEDGRVAAL